MRMKWGRAGQIAAVGAVGYYGFTTNGDVNIKGVEMSILDLCQYFGHKKLKVYADIFNSSSSFCWGVI